MEPEGRNADEPKWQSRYLSRGSTRAMRRTVNGASPEALMYLSPPRSVEQEESLDLSDYSPGDIFRGIVMLFYRLHPRWRHATVSVPVLSILLALAIPVVHFVLRIIEAGRNGSMSALDIYNPKALLVIAERPLVDFAGFAPSDPASYFTFPFGQQLGLLTIFAVPLFACCALGLGLGVAFRKSRQANMLKCPPCPME